MGEDKKRRRLPVSFSALLLIGAASVAATTAMLHARTDTPVSATVSQAAGARVEREAVATATATTTPAEPPLIEILQAADALIKAGAIAPPPEPTLAEILESADALAKAGLLEPSPEPSLYDVLRAVQELDAANALPPMPETSLQDALIAAQMLSDAGALPEAPPPPPAQREPGPRTAPPPPPPPAPPPPEPTATPVPEVIAPPPAPAGDGWFDAEYTQAVWSGVNARRTAAGLRPVSAEARLMRASTDYAITMANAETFSHTGPDGSTLVTRIEGAGFPFTVMLGEILAMGSLGWEPASVVQAWMDSPAHREQMMEPSYAFAGLACYFSDDSGATMVRCVMNFAAAR